MTAGRGPNPDPTSPVAAGGPTKEPTSGGHPDIVWHPGMIDRAARVGARLVAGVTVLFTGLSGAGKSTIAAELERQLVEERVACCRLDGDNVRHGLNGDLGFSPADRAENVRRVGEVARLMADVGIVVLVPVIAPYAGDRERMRAAHAAAGLRFVEVFVDAPLAVVERRDTKGLYARARAGQLVGMTGVDAPYEPPSEAEVVVDTVGVAVADNVATLRAHLGL